MFTLPVPYLNLNNRNLVLQPRSWTIFVTNLTFVTDLQGNSVPEGHLHNNNNKGAEEARQTCRRSYFFFLHTLTPAERRCALFPGFDGGHHSSEAASLITSQRARASLPASSSDSTPFVSGRVAAVKSSPTKNFGTSPDCGHGCGKTLQRKVLPFSRWNEWPRNKTGTQAALQIQPWLSKFTYPKCSASQRSHPAGRRCSAEEKWCPQAPALSYLGRLCHSFFGWGGQIW